MRTHLCSSAAASRQRSCGRVNSTDSAVTESLAAPDTCRVPKNVGTRRYDDVRCPTPSPNGDQTKADYEREVRKAQDTLASLLIG